MALSEIRRKSPGRSPGCLTSGFCSPSMKVSIQFCTLTPVTVLNSCNTGNRKFDKVSLLFIDLFVIFELEELAK